MEAEAMSTPRKQKTKTLKLWGVFQTEGCLFSGFDHYEDAQWCVEMFKTKKLAEDYMVREFLDGFCDVRQVSLSFKEEEK